MNRLNKVAKDNVITRIKTGAIITGYVLVLFLLLAFSDVRQNGWVRFIPHNGLKILAPICGFLFVGAIGWLVYFVAEELVKNFLKAKDKKTIWLIVGIMSAIEFVPTLFYLLANYGAFPSHLDKEIWVYLFLFTNLGMGFVFYPILLHMVDSRSARKSFNTFIFPLLVIGVAWSFEWIYYFAIIRYWTTFFLLLAIVVSYDVFAYFSGVLFGKKRIAPSISPNKTWEGTLIGAAASLVLAIVIFSLYSLNTSVHSGLDGHWDNAQWSFFGSQLGVASDIRDSWRWTLSIFLIIILVVSAIVGDLFFSYCKRRNGIKDFGNKLPGHGGVLDRLDSLLFSVFVFGTITGAIAFLSTIAHRDAGAMFPNLAY